jgi:hypothetical protein
VEPERKVAKPQPRACPKRKEYHGEGEEKAVSKRFKRK